MEDEGDLIEILRKIFEADPGKTTIELKDKCSDCGCEIIVNITSTAGGFGLQGGALFKSSPDEYFVKCPDCYTEGEKMRRSEGERERK